MAPTDQGAAVDAKVLELRANYWLKRLDHTLTHTQTSSRLIYIVDGAVLALIYFAVQAFGGSRQIVLVMSAPTILLMVLSLFHARLVIIQREHYPENRICQVTIRRSGRDYKGNCVRRPDEFQLWRSSDSPL